jgi:hypothetical protein
LGGGYGAVFDLETSAIDSRLLTQEIELAEGDDVSIARDRAQI